MSMYCIVAITPNGAWYNVAAFDTQEEADKELAAKHAAQEAGKLSSQWRFEVREYKPLTDELNDKIPY